jgi:hypothetical protein
MSHIVPAPHAPPPKGIGQKSKVVILPTTAPNPLPFCLYRLLPLFPFSFLAVPFCSSRFCFLFRFLFSSFLFLRPLFLSPSLLFIHLHLFTKAFSYFLISIPLFYWTLSLSNYLLCSLSFPTPLSFYLYHLLPLCHLSFLDELFSFSHFCFLFRFLFSSFFSLSPSPLSVPLPPPLLFVHLHLFTKAFSHFLISIPLFYWTLSLSNYLLCSFSLFPLLTHCHSVSVAYWLSFPFPFSLYLFVNPHIFVSCSISYFPLFSFSVPSFCPPLSPPFYFIHLHLFTKKFLSFLSP